MKNIKKETIEIEKRIENEKQKKKYEEQKEMFFENKQKFIEKNKKAVKFLSELIPELKNKYAIFLDQNINTEELLNILKKHEIFYSKERLEEILKFIEIKNLETFTLRELINNIQLNKLINTTIDSSQFSSILNQIKDIIYVHGGEKFLFNNEINKKETIDLNTFIQLLKDKSSLSVDILKSVFYYIVKRDRDMTIEDYNEYFVPKIKNLNIYNEQYFINMMKKIILKMSEKFMTPSEYYDHLLSYSNTEIKVISRLNWIKYMLLEKYEFHTEDLDNIFNWIDDKSVKDDLDNTELKDEDMFREKPIYNETIKYNEK